MWLVVSTLHSQSIPLKVVVVISGITLLVALKKLELNEFAISKRDYAEDLNPVNIRGVEVKFGHNRALCKFSKLAFFKYLHRFRLEINYCFARYSDGDMLMMSLKARLNELNVR